MKTFLLNPLWTAVSAVCVCAPTWVYASGYHFGTQSVSAQATANASAAEAVDATTVFYNPAGMTRLSGTQFSGALNFVSPHVTYRNAHAQYPDQPYAPTPLPNGTTLPAGLNRSTAVLGRTRGNVTEDVFLVPHLYVTHQLNDRLTVGVGAFVPFASGVNYPHSSVLRYNVNETQLKTFTIMPSVAFKATPEHAFAVGVMVQYADAKLRQFANFGGSVNPALNALRPKMGAGHGQSDGYATVTGSDWGVGYSLAWLWSMDEHTRFGMAYRSQVRHVLKGSAEWQLPNTASGQRAQAAGYRTGNASVAVNTPESLSLHGFHQIDDRWAIMGDATWTRHSRFRTILIDYAQPKKAGFAHMHHGASTDFSVLYPKWKNTWKFALGASYQYDPRLQLRFGVAYDQTPVPDTAHRMSTMPDNDRIWLSLGGRYALDKHHSVNVAYSYLHIKDGSAELNGYCGGKRAGEVNCVSSYVTGRADYRSHAHILGVQYNRSF